jgi:hypothetical protein
MVMVITVSGRARAMVPQVHTGWPWRLAGGCRMGGPRVSPVDTAFPSAASLRGAGQFAAGRVLAVRRCGLVLEIGSGPGWDADHLEFRGLRVVRTDAVSAFVERLRAAGHDARLLDVRTGELGGPYQAVLANAVLPHLDRDQFEDVLRRARCAVVVGGALGFTVKEGDGAGWSDHKLGLPRHFTYWREPALRAVLRRTGWRVDYLDHVAVRDNCWLRVLARRDGDAQGESDRRVLAGPTSWRTISSPLCGRSCVEDAVRDPCWRCPGPAWARGSAAWGTCGGRCARRAWSVQRPGSSSARPSNEVVCAAAPMVGAAGRHPVLAMR